MKKEELDKSRRKLLISAGISLVPFTLMGCGGGGGGGGSVVPTPNNPITPPAPVLKPSSMKLGIPIIVDQFGYLPNQPKIAIIRDPQSDVLGTMPDGTSVISFDAEDSYAPGATYEVVNASTKAVVYSGTISAWNNGATDPSSGDKVWHFDFSDVTTNGEYYILDKQNNVKSYTFKIAADVYLPVLKAAVRYFYYQRAGQEKLAAHAGANWADGASHLGSGQDRNARLFTAKDDATKERDVSGGWYDAGDPNKYTSWTASYIVGLLYAYTENPTVWGDDYNIPESGNSIPDIIDEVKWGLDWLIKMQEPDGSVLSIAGLSSGSPPSSATGATYYGPVNTSATLNSAAAFAQGAKVLSGFPAFSAYAANLSVRAESAWDWAIANPNVIFSNVDGLGAGQQETDDRGRFIAKLQAAIYLFGLTNKTIYRDFIDANYNQANLIKFNNYVSPYETGLQDALLYYASNANATPSVAKAIKDNYTNGANSDLIWGKISTKTDPYFAYIPNYIWGSNSIKCNFGQIFTTLNTHGLGSAHSASENLTAAANYIHYIHGVNPFGLCYLTNMSTLGAENSANEIWHFWFTNGTKWDRPSDTTPGPPPGFLPGGANKEQWDWDSRCPTINPACGTQRPTPPYAQPPQKSYKDFNDGWPLISWPLTEVSNGYQVAYIRLLSKFI